MMLNLNTECEGWFSLSAFKQDKDGHEIAGSRRPLGAVFHNLITNGGLDQMGTSGAWLRWCQVGSGTADAAFTDTGLVSRVAGSTTKATSSGVQATAPYYTWVRNVYRFAAGVAAGNLSEVGISWLSTGSMFSRARIVDGAGAPTTITVLADEFLDVTYEFRKYLPAADATGTIVLEGVTQTWTARAANATLTSARGVFGWEILENGTSEGSFSLNSSGRVAYAGSIGAITSTPTGTAQLTGTGSVATYVAGDYYSDITFSYALDAGNFPSPGITAFMFKMGIGTFQFGFSPGILKTSSKVLSLTFRHSWSRKTL